MTATERRVGRPAARPRCRAGYRADGTRGRAPAARAVGRRADVPERAGRPAEALTVYERTRQTLADQLGTDPSPELSAVHTALRGQIDKAPAPTVEAARRTNLRTPLTSFVGRDADVAAVSELVDDYRLTTLVGPGGFGKTRLAVEVSRAMLDSCRTVSGWWSSSWSPTAPRCRPQCWRRWICGSRRSSVEKAEDPVDRLIAALRSRRLSWCSTTASTSSQPLRRWPTGCSRSARGCESRDQPGATRHHRRGSLASRSPGLPPEDLESRDLLSYDAVRLLVDRARAVRRVSR